MNKKQNAQTKELSQEALLLKAMNDMTTAMLLMTEELVSIRTILRDGVYKN